MKTKLTILLLCALISLTVNVNAQPSNFIPGTATDVTITCGESVAIGNFDANFIAVGGNSNALSSVYVIDATHGWAVGSGGTIMKYDGSNWMPFGPPMFPTYNLISVHFTDTTHGWAVGDNGAMGKIIKYDGTNWTDVTCPTANLLSSVYFADATHGWAVGKTGTIIKYDGASWTLFTSPTINNLISVYFTDTLHGWAVGDNGTIIKYDGVNWITVTSPTTNLLQSVYFTDSTHGWAVGKNGTIIKYDGVNWTTVTSPTAKDLYSVCSTDTAHAWAVGGAETVIKYNGTNWTDVTYSTTPAILTSVFFIDAAHGWVLEGQKIKGSVLSVKWTPNTNLSNDTIANPLANPNADIIYQATVTITGGKTQLDTVTVNVDPLTAEAGADKQIVCGGAAQLDSVTSNYTGTDVLSYQWSPSTGLNYDTIQNPTATVTSDTKYFVTITTSNGCIATDSVTVNVNPLTAEADSSWITCGNIATLNVTTNYTGTDTLTYSWLPTAGLDNANVANPHTSVTSNKTYYVTVTTSNGCTATDSAFVYLMPLGKPDICMVSVDTSINKNFIVWERTIAGIDHYNIYKKGFSGTYDLIGTVPYDSMTVFTDTLSNPSAHADFYKLSVTDTCGSESAQSDYHKTMSLSTTQGGQLGQHSLIWDEYEGFTYNYYRIYRGTAPNNLILLDSIVSGSPNYNDTAIIMGNVYYLVQIVKPTSCVASSGSKAPTKTYTTSVSNMEEYMAPGGIEEGSQSNFSVYPNPFNVTTTLNLTTPLQNATLIIYDVLGKEIKRMQNLNGNQIIINRTGMQNGMYFYSVMSEKRLIGNGKIVVE